MPRFSKTASSFPERDRPDGALEVIRVKSHVRVLQERPKSCPSLRYETRRFRERIRWQQCFCVQLAPRLLEETIDQWKSWLSWLLVMGPYDILGQHSCEETTQPNGA